MLIDVNKVFFELSVGKQHMFCVYNVCLFISTIKVNRSFFGNCFAHVWDMHVRVLVHGVLVSRSSLVTWSHIIL